MSKLEQKNVKIIKEIKITMGINIGNGTTLQGNINIGTDFKEIIIDSTTDKIKGENLTNWYKCNNCTKYDINPAYNYCPICGCKINWKIGKRWR